MYRKDIIRINEFSGNRICQKSAHLCRFSLHARARAHTHTHALSLSLSHTHSLPLSLSLSHTHTHRLEKYVALVTLMIPFHWLRELEKKRRWRKKEKQKQQIWTGLIRRPYRMVCSKQVEQSGREVRATRSNRRTCAREPRYCNVSTSCLSGRTRGGKKKKKKKKVIL